MRRHLAAVVALACCGCRTFDAGLPDDAPEDVARDGGALADAAGSVDVAGEIPRPPDAALDANPDPPGLPGRLDVVGCSDGTREGFTSFVAWPDIAGCSGGWSVPGLLGAEARGPQCDSLAGDSSDNPAGVGCSVADLCAAGWHVCRDASEVERRSPTECEISVRTGERRFFLVLAAASPLGVCSPDGAATNDLHGCGSVGQAQGLGCQPLDRRMGFADCLSTDVWRCGSVANHLDEARLVTKSGPSLGGVLCCRDP